MYHDILPPTDDWVFKLLFGDERSKSMLADLLKSFVKLPNEAYELTFLDTHLKPEAEDDKLGIVDVKVRTTGGEIINVEIQMHPVKNIGKRLSFYKSKLIVEQIGKRELYKVIKKVICVCITDYGLFPREYPYMNGFRFYNRENGLCFEEIPEEIYTLELPKVPEEWDGSEVWAWMQFLKARREEEFEMVAEQNVEIRKAVDTLYELSGDEKVRGEYELRQKAWRDRMSQLDGYYQDGLQKGFQDGELKGELKAVRKLQKYGMEPGQIAEALGLPLDTVFGYLNAP
jgi:predicted transposase/invertase (TIGR01784 family)